MKTAQFNRMVIMTIPFCCVLLFSCTKTVDFYAHHPELTSGFCRIVQFVAISTYSTDSIRFEYNVHGDPVAAINNNVRTGAPDFLFGYDRQHRLTTLVGRYAPGPFINGEVVESSHAFYRDGFNRIVLDSAFSFPTIVNGKPIRGQYGTPVLIKYEYDYQNRISKQIIALTGHIIENSYAYDAAGNLTGSTYDNKINYRRVNEIWMFLDRDYSRNNPLSSAYTYNSAGLPTQIVAKPPGVNYFMDVTINATFYTQANIEYSCKSDGPGK